MVRTTNPEVRALQQAYEQAHLPEISSAVGASLSRQLVGLTSQLPLFDDGTLRGTLQAQLMERHPDFIVVDPDLFDNLRFEAAAIASGHSDEEISAALGSNMWDMILQNPRFSITDNGENSYDLFTNTFVMSPDAATCVFARDYEQIAWDRFIGSNLLHFDEGEQR